MHVNFFTTPHASYRYAAFFLIMVSLGSLVSALIAQYVFELRPCVLCLYQRVPYVVIAVLSGLSLFTPFKITRALIAFCGVTFLTGGAIAFFHVGVEQHWWAFETCSTTFNTTDLDALREQLLNAPTVRCDDVAWSLFGISMAGYNFLMSLGLGAITLLYAAMRKTT